MSNKNKKLGLGIAAVAVAGAGLVYAAQKTSQQKVKKIAPPSIRKSIRWPSSWTTSATGT